MRNLWVVSMMLGLGLGACGGGGLEGEVKDWKEKMCKCADKACADKTWDEYRDWRKGKRDAAKDLSKDSMEKIMSTEKELKGCRDKARGAATGDMPAAPAPAPAPEPAPAKAP